MLQVAFSFGGHFAFSNPHLFICCFRERRTALKERVLLAFGPVGREAPSRGHRSKAFARGVYQALANALTTHRGARLQNPGGLAPSQKPGKRRQVRSTRRTAVTL